MLLSPNCINLFFYELFKIPYKQILIVRWERERVIEGETKRKRETEFEIRIPIQGGLFVSTANYIQSSS